MISILKKHFEKFKNIQEFVLAMISAVTIKQIIKKLLKCDRIDVIEVVYCLKKQFNEKMNNNSLLYENYKNKLRKKARKNC